MTTTENRKSLTIELKADGPEGSFSAAFARFGELDHDKDLTLPGAFTPGAPFRVAQWAHNWGVPTIGSGVIKVNGRDAHGDAEFNLKMVAGREHYESVKYDAEHHQLQQWSYAFDIVKGRPPTDPELKKYPGVQRVLESLMVHEMSPVLLGAGKSTHTDFIKSLSLTAGDDLARTALVVLVDRWKAVASDLQKEGRAISGTRRARITDVIGAARTASQAAADAADELQRLLDETDVDPEKARKESDRLRSDFLRLASRNPDLMQHIGGSTQ